MKQFRKNFMLMVFILTLGSFYSCLSTNPHSTPLLDAVMKGNLKQVKNLVEKGADINAGNYTFTPLERAANDGNLEIVEYLLSKNAMTPQKAFERAVEKKHIDVIKLLIRSGKININKSARYFRSFFDDKSITFEQRMQTVNELTEGKLNSPYLLMIVEPENYQNVIDFFKINISDKVDELGHSVLHTAANLNNVNLVTFLLEKKININLLDNNNHTALFYCITSFGPSINWEKPITEDETSAKINYLGGMPQYLNPTDVKTRQAQVFKLLINAGINVNQQNKEGWTVLHFASYAYPETSLEILKSNNVNQKLKTNFGRTADDIQAIRPK
jgi:ankyrin repeat protein